MQTSMPGLPSPTQTPRRLSTDGVRTTAPAHSASCPSLPCPLHPTPPGSCLTWGLAAVPPLSPDFLSRAQGLGRPISLRPPPSVGSLTPALREGGPSTLTPAPQPSMRTGTQKTQLADDHAQGHHQERRPLPGRLAIFPQVRVYQQAGILFYQRLNEASVLR